MHLSLRHHTSVTKVPFKPIKAPFKCDKLLKSEERGTKTTLEQNININSSSVFENALLIQN